MGFSWRLERLTRVCFLGRTNRCRGSCEVPTHDPDYSFGLEGCIYVRKVARYRVGAPRRNRAPPSPIHECTSDHFYDGRHHARRRRGAIDGGRRGRAERRRRARRGPSNDRWDLSQTLTEAGGSATTCSRSLRWFPPASPYRLLAPTEEPASQDPRGHQPRSTYSGTDHGCFRWFVEV